MFVTILTSKSSLFALKSDSKVVKKRSKLIVMFCVALGPDFLMFWRGPHSVLSIPSNEKTRFSKNKLSLSNCF